MEAADIERFWKKIEKTGSCWIWKGSVDKRRMDPILHTKSGQLRPRHISLILAGKEVISRIRVSCKNSLCVNPDHLVNGDEERFWAKVQKFGTDECWPWIGGFSNGYGAFRHIVNGKSVCTPAQVYSFELRMGRPITKDCGLCACHTCDHPWCVNPNHIFIGSKDDNNKDKVAKGRQARGETNASAKLTEDLVRKARERYDIGESIGSLALAFGTSRAAMSMAVRRLSWRHVN